MKILLAVDGSEYTQRAARFLAGHLEWFAKPPEVHVLNIRPPFPFPGAAARVGKAAIEDYERDEALKALAVAEGELTKARVAYTSVWVMGDIAAEITAYAKKHGMDLIVMGSHGYGTLLNLTVGSSTTKVLALAEVPVVIVP